MSQLREELIQILKESKEKNDFNTLQILIESITKSVMENMPKEKKIIEKTIEPEIKVDEENLRIKIKTTFGWSDWIEFKPLIREYIEKKLGEKVEEVKKGLKEDSQKILESLKDELENQLFDVLVLGIQEEIKKYYTKLKEEIQNELQPLKEELKLRLLVVEDLFEEYFNVLEEYVKENAKPGPEGPQGPPGLPGPPPQVRVNDFILEVQGRDEKWHKIDFNPLIESLKEKTNNLIQEVNTFISNKEQEIHKIQEEVQSVIRDKFSLYEEQLKLNQKEVQKLIQESEEKIRILEEEFNKSKEKLDSYIVSLKDEIYEQVEEKINKTLNEVVNLNCREEENDVITESIQSFYTGLKEDIQNLEQKITVFESEFNQTKNSIQNLNEQIEELKNQPKLVIQNSIIGLQDKSGKWIQYIDLSKFFNTYSFGSGIGLEEIQVRIEEGTLRTVHVENPVGEDKVVNKIKFESPIFTVEYEEDGTAKVRLESWEDQEGIWRTEEILIEEDGIREVEVDFPIQVGYQRVYWNGVKLKYGEQHDYTISGNKVIFNEGIYLMRDDVITIEYVRKRI